MKDKFQKNKVGNKAFQLLLFKNKGFNIPDFFIITSDMDNDDIIQNLSKCSEKKLYAVRSSSIDEDNKYNSEAGQFKTFIRVKKKDILTNILKVRDSLGVPVIVQEWIEGDYSGIAFSRDPLAEYILPVVEYTKGTAENNVAGIVTPNKIIGTNYNIKNSKSYIKKVFKLVVDIENIFNGPVDIEWVYKDKSLFLIQVRPITSLGYSNIDILKKIDSLVFNKKEYIYERADIFGTVFNNSRFNKDLVSYIFDTSHTFDYVYRTIGIDYFSENYFYPLGSYFYLNKQEELQQLTPSYKYRTKDLNKTSIFDLGKLIPTFKNVFNFARFSQFNKYPESLKIEVEELLNRELIIKDISSLKEIVSTVYGKIILMGLYVSIDEKKKSKLYSKSPPLNILNDPNYIGNIFDIFDESTFIYSDLNVNEKDYISNFREYSRWLSVKLVNTIRRYLFDIAERNNIKNKKLLFHITFDELEKRIIDKDILIKRKELFDKDSVLEYPVIISDLPDSSRVSDITILSPGEFFGVLREKIDDNDEADVVLYTQSITPDLIEIFPKVSAIITRHGGTLSHLAILAREQGIPVIQTKKKIKIGSSVCWSHSNGLIIFDV